MKFLGNKFFIFGVLALILISIPLTLFLVKRQQQTKTKAAATTILSFVPSSVTKNPGESFDLDIEIDPDQNEVSFMKVKILFDATKLQVDKDAQDKPKITINQTAFPFTVEEPKLGEGFATFTIGSGSDNTQSVRTRTKVATITFKALADTGSSPAQIAFDPSTNVVSSATTDFPAENVLKASPPASVTIGSTTQPSPTPTEAPGNPSPTPTSTQTNPTPTPTPTQTGGNPSPNQAPVCTSLALDRSTTGTAPYAVTFTINGNDPDGTVSKVLINFGDGPVQEITRGGNIGNKTINVPVAHTYNNIGTYTATATIVDNSGAQSSGGCSQSITVSASGTGSTTDQTNTNIGGVTTPTPTLAATGDVKTTIGIAGGIILVILGGVFLLAL